MIAIKGAIATGTAVAALLSAGCVSVLPEAAPPGPRYALAPVSTPDQYAELASNDAAGAGLAAARVSWSLAIEDPVASRAIDTTKIARVSEGFEYRYFAGGEWTDRAPRLVSLALARSFENSDRILNVGTRINVPL